MRTKAKTLIERLGFQDPDRSTPLHDTIQFWLYENLSDILDERVGSEYKHEITWKRLECPITVTTPSGYKTVVGFIDLVAGGYLLKRNSEQLFERVGSIQMAFEIKSMIPSCGELLRQISFYRKYHDDRHLLWVVVSPDDRYNDILRDHAIRFVKYEVRGH